MWKMTNLFQTFFWCFVKIVNNWWGGLCYGDYNVIMKSKPYRILLQIILFYWSSRLYWKYRNAKQVFSPVYSQWFARRRRLCSYWPSDTPRGRAVTRFPGTRQEEEKQNKPERAVTARGLHWKGGLIISNRGTYTTSNTKKDVCVGVLKVSRTVIYPFWGTLLSSISVFRGGGGLALKLTVGWLLLCIELQLGWGRGRMEAILTVNCGWKEARLVSSALKSIIWAK